MSRTPFRRRPEPEPQPEAEAEQPETLAEEIDRDEELRMTILEHLNELRKRLTRIFVALILGTLLGLVFALPALEFLQGPYCQIRAPESCEFVILGPTGGVVSYFRVALMLGAIIAIPMMTYQAMMFIMPGLTAKERRLVLLSLPAVVGLFMVGVAFTWYLLMPPALGFLEGFQPQLFRPEWTADLYLGFVTALIFWMGVAFETPLVFFVMSLLGLVQARALIKNWRIAVVFAAVAAAMITPTIDPVNMFLVMGPLLALYALSIVLVFIGRRLARLEPWPFSGQTSTSS